jgi:hypothetical protein
MLTACVFADRHTPARNPELNASLLPYSAACARDGAMNQATTRTAKARNATAITSWLLRLNQWDLRSLY